jgi:RNA polymerase sigma-70 factor (ECF subfamily)
VDQLTRLALEAGDGDRAALAAFVERSQGDVWRLCAYLVGRAWADDATQETFLRAIGALRSFRGEATAKTWLLSIARRTCSDLIRRSSRRRSLFGRVSVRAVDGATSLGGTVEVEELLAALDERQREAFVLTQLMGLSYGDAAEACGCPVGTIRSRVARARAALVVAAGGAAAVEG